MDEEIKSILNDHEERIQGLERIFKTEPEKIKKQVSIKEFIISKKPKDDIQKTLVIGYYLENQRVFCSFNVKDLKDGFREAKESLPSNINQMVNENIKKGYMMEAEQKKDEMKAWVLTNTGEGFVNDLEKEK